MKDQDRPHLPPRRARAADCSAPSPQRRLREEIKKQYGFDIDKRKIHLDTDIKAFGGYHIEVKLYNGITAKLAVSVTEAQ